MEKRAYTPVGVCSEKIYFTIDGGGSSTSSSLMAATATCRA
jgi:hypothetical protein